MPRPRRRKTTPSLKSRRDWRRFAVTGRADSRQHPAGLDSRRSFAGAGSGGARHHRREPALPTRCLRDQQRLAGPQHRGRGKGNRRPLCAANHRDGQSVQVVPRTRRQTRRKRWRPSSWRSPSNISTRVSHCSVRMKRETTGMGLRRRRDVGARPPDADCRERNATPALGQPNSLGPLSERTHSRVQARAQLGRGSCHTSPVPGSDEEEVPTGAAAVPPTEEAKKARIQKDYVRRFIKTERWAAPRPANCAKPNSAPLSRSPSKTLSRWNTRVRSSTARMRASSLRCASRNIPQHLAEVALRIVSRWCGARDAFS